MNSTYLLLCAATLTILSACASHPPDGKHSVSVATGGAVAAVDKNDPESGSVVANLLSQTLQENLGGLSSEPLAERERLLGAAQQLLDTRGRKAHGSAPAIRKRHVEACQKDEPQDMAEATLCRLWYKAAGYKPPRPHKTQSLARSAWGRKRLGDLKRAMQMGDIGKLAQATDSEIYQTLRKSPRLDQMPLLVSRALDNSACAPAVLLTGLGLKSEESFPETDFRELAEAFYARSMECGTGPDSVKSAYRLGLLQIWDQKYAQAEKTLARVTDNPAADDYRSRIIYWRYYSAKQSGDSETQERMRVILNRDFHLTLHGLITVGPRPTDNRPRVAFRSQARPQLNGAVRVAEAMLELGARQEAIDALDPLVDDILDAEPAFRLYVGLLFMRAGDSLHKFKVLTGLYRDYPGMLSRESLGMLFPLNRFEDVRSHERKADPFLVISLIRQESAFNERARSPVGAVGLMQLMPRTARRMERVSKLGLYDPKINIRLGVRFFSHLTARYGGEAELALAAYNAGPDNVDTWVERYPVANRLLFVDLIPFRETREYVAAIARNYFWYKRLYEVDATAAADAGRPPASGVVPAGAPMAPGRHSFFKLFDS